VLILLTSIVLYVLKSTTTRARPIAASAATIVRIKNTKTYPELCLSIPEKVTKFVFTPKNISSIDIRSTSKLLRFMIIPAIPIQKITELNIR
jgi:hypothetical protein